MANVVPINIPEYTAGIEALSVSMIPFCSFHSIPPYLKSLQPRHLISHSSASFSYITLSFHRCFLVLLDLSWLALGLFVLLALFSSSLTFLLSFLSVRTLIDASGCSLPHIFNKTFLLNSTYEQFCPQLHPVESNLKPMRLCLNFPFIFKSSKEI